MNFNYIYFIDRSLGKYIGKALEELGVEVQFHNQHFMADSPDKEQIEF